MTMDELIDYLRQNEDVGRNKPTTEVKIAIGILRLKDAGFPDPGTEYHKLLKAFNGLSNNGCVVLGINTESSLFPDLLAYNTKEKENIRPGEVVLGYDDSYWLVSNPKQKKYRIIDPEDGSEEGATESLAELIPYIMHI